MITALDDQVINTYSKSVYVCYPVLLFFIPGHSKGETNGCIMMICAPQEKVLNILCGFGLLQWGKDFSC